VVGGRRPPVSRCVHAWTERRQHGPHARKGGYVISFFYPVVPMGKARIRTQISVLYTREDLDFAMDQFSAVKNKLGI